MNAKENFLEAVAFGTPEYVPLGNEEVWWAFAMRDPRADGDAPDSWGIEWEPSADGVSPFPRLSPLPTLDRLADYEFPSPRDFILAPEERARLAALDRGEKLAMGHMPHLLFERACDVMGMENFLMSLVSHPDEARRLLHGIAEFARGMFDRFLELDVDVVSATDDLGTERSLMVSPSMFREFLLPEYAHAFENVRRAGKLIRLHSCGCIQDIAGDLAGAGVSLLNPIQATANDLGRVKAETFGQMALAGGISTGVLMHDSPDDVRAEVVRVMDILKPGAGYVCRPDQSLPGIPEENMDALWQTAREAGRY